MWRFSENWRGLAVVVLVMLCCVEFKHHLSLAAQSCDLDASRKRDSSRCKCAEKALTFCRPLKEPEGISEFEEGGKP